MSGKWLKIIIFISLLHVDAFGETPPQPDGFKIAFIADAHFHDVYARFEDGVFEGLIDGTTGKNATIRTMLAQLTSTRLFNENYFALQAALADLARKNIKYVGLVGDFSDDGQTIHLRGLKEILDAYTQQYGISFFAVPGNHDPGRPVDYPGGKSDFMGEGGQEQKIFSKDSKECNNSQTIAGKGLPVVCTQDILQLGYGGILNVMGKYGFYPQKDYRYWATPYSSYDYNNYTYEKALEESALSGRTYEECLEGTGGKYKKDGYTKCFSVEDASYLVEPVEGIWLLAIDANVYVPTRDADTRNPGLPGNFDGSGNAGYNKMISHKTQVVEWIADVVEKAREKNKVLITFSHFPMVDFYDNNSEALSELFGEDQLDLRRMPTEETSRQMAATGVRLNIAGHLHFNDTGVRNYDGNFLANIQVPSLAAYVPGYKILTVKNKDMMEIETVEMQQVPRFKELFSYYEMEHAYLNANAPSKNWNESILQSSDYTEYADWHLTELTRKRFLPQWPAQLREMLEIMNGKDILVYTQLDIDVPMADLSAIKAGRGVVSPEILKAWKKAEKQAKKLAGTHHLSLDDFEKWTGLDLATDFYRLMNADELSLRYMDRKKILEYSVICGILAAKKADNTVNELFSFYFNRLFACMYHFSNGECSDQFIVDFGNQKLIDLTNNINRITCDDPAK